MVEQAVREREQGLSPEGLRRLELLRTNFLEYAPKVLKIRTKAGKVVPFILNEAQSHVHAQIEDQKRRTGRVRAIILKGRQQGISTYTEGRYYWLTTMNQGKKAYILTHLDEATTNLFNMTRRYHELCPDEMRVSTRNNSGKQLFFDKNQSEFAVATAESKGTGRSATAQLFHGSEVGFWPNAEDHMAGIGQIVPDENESEMILESTANGVGNLFHSMWQDAEAGISEYMPIFVPWFWQKEYRKQAPVGWQPEGEDADYAKAFGLDLDQAYWKNQKTITDFRGDRGIFDQEYPGSPALAFSRVDGDPLIPMDLVLAAVAAGKKDLPEDAGPMIWGLDVAEYGQDDTALAIRQGRVVKSVQRWHGRGPMEVAGIIGRLADMNPPDAINVDCTGVGSGVADRLIELGYPVNRIHFGERALRDELYGIRRDEMWGEMKAWLEDKPAILPDDSRLISDLTGPQYSYDSSRRLKLEQKEKMKKRGLKSPDAGDSVALTFAIPFNPSARRNAIDHGRRRNWRA
jgi:hypothetical protein